MSEENLFAEAGGRIRELRGRSSQGEFAERLGVNRKTVERWESGERLPDGQSLLALMTECGADVNYILKGRTEDRKLTSEELTMLAYFRDATPDVRRAAMGALVGATAQTQPHIKKITMNNKTPGGVQVGIQSGGTIKTRKSQ